MDLTIPQFAFELLEDVHQSHNENGKYENLQALHDVFGHILISAGGFLETATVLEYATGNGVRKLLKVCSKTESFTLFANINFCYCPVFKQQVLEARKLITCKHVLAAKLAKIRGDVKVEFVTDLQFVALLNDFINYVEDVKIEM